MLTFQEKALEEAEEPVVVGVGVIKMKEIRLFISFLVLVETRSILPKLIKFSGVLLKPVPCLIKSIHAWVPATSGMVVTHALSGATTEVQSSLGSQINLKVGETLDYQFYTSRYSAQSFAVEGLPPGVSSDLNYGSGKLTGVVTQPGNYQVEIVGYRYPGNTGSATPTFTINVTVEQSSSILSYFTPNELSTFSNLWYESAWLGFFYKPDSFSWLYHQRLGWLFADAKAVDELWLYDTDLGWLYTSKEIYPHFFRNSSQSWLYHLEDSQTHRFWDYSSEITLP